MLEFRAGLSQGITTGAGPYRSKQTYLAESVDYNLDLEDLGIASVDFRPPQDPLFRNNDESVNFRNNETIGFVYDSNNRTGNKGNLETTKEINDTIDLILNGMQNPYGQDK